LAARKARPHIDVFQGIFFLIHEHLFNHQARREIRKDPGNRTTARAYTAIQAIIGPGTVNDIR
jgi:hypothetical protein